MNRRNFVATPRIPSPPASRRAPSFVPIDSALVLLLEYLNSILKHVEGHQSETAGESTDRVESWNDDNYHYLEATLAGVNLAGEVDLYLGNGMTFVRIKRGDTQEPISTDTKPHSRRRA